MLLAHSFLANSSLSSPDPFSKFSPASKSSRKISTHIGGHIHSLPCTLLLIFLKFSMHVIIILLSPAFAPGRNASAKAVVSMCESECVLVCDVYSH